MTEINNFVNQIITQTSNNSKFQVAICLLPILLGIICYIIYKIIDVKATADVKTKSLKIYLVVTLFLGIVEVILLFTAPSYFNARYKAKLVNDWHQVSQTQQKRKVLNLEISENKKVIIIPTKDVQTSNIFNNYRQHHILKLPQNTLVLVITDNKNNNLTKYTLQTDHKVCTPAKLTIQETSLNSIIYQAIDTVKNRS